MCNCLPPQAAAGLICFIVFLQGLIVLLSSALLQWADCNMPGFQEFSFGLFRIRLDAISVDAVDINLHNVVETGKLVSGSIQHLATATDATFWIILVGLLFGIVGGVVAVLGSMPKRPGNAPPMTMFRAAGGFIGFDIFLVVVALCIYGFGVMPALGEIGIGDLIGGFASGFSSLIGVGGAASSIIGGAVGAAMDCEHPYILSGMILTIITVFLLGGACFTAFLGVNYAAIDPMQAMEARDMRSEMMSMQHGGYGKGGGKGGKGGPQYGAPPPGSYYGGGYGGPPPPGGGYGGPPPGSAYGGRAHPFEGGYGAGRQGPGYGAPPPQQQRSYGYNYGMMAY